MIKGVFRIMLIVAVSIFSMIQAASFMLGFPHSPEPIFMIGKLPLHGATAVQTWERAGLLHGDVERFAYSIGLLVAGSLVFVWLKNRQYSMRQSERASWGTAHDARRAKLLSRRGVVLGKIGWRTIRDNSDAHIGIMAPPGAGKSTTIAIPTLLGGWRQAVIVHDPKGELWSKTSAWRRQHVGPVLRFDLTDQHTVRYNPLTEIRWNTSHKMGDAQALARALVPIGSSTDSYFENLALQFLTALILFVGDTQKDPSLAQIRELADEGYVVMATLQYTEYYEYAPTAQQQADFEALIAAGATAVSGSQGHHAQGFGFYQGGFIHYGPGNLFFDQMDMLGTRQTFVDTYTVYNGRLLNVELWTGLIENYARPRLMTPDERAQALTAVFQASGW